MRVSDGRIQKSAWLIIDNKVYDVTSVLPWHPGGAKAILTYAGKATVDVTNEVCNFHILTLYITLTITFWTVVQRHS